MTQQANNANAARAIAKHYAQRLQGRQWYVDVWRHDASSELFCRLLLSQRGYFNDARWAVDFWWGADAQASLSLPFEATDTDATVEERVRNALDAGPNAP